MSLGGRGALGAWNSGLESVRHPADSVGVAVEPKNRNFTLYLEHRNLSNVHYYTVYVHKRHFLQGTRIARPCFSGCNVVYKVTS